MLLRLGEYAGIDLQRQNPADHERHQGGVVAGAGADLQRLQSGRQTQIFQDLGHERGLA